MLHCFCIEVHSLSPTEAHSSKILVIADIKCLTLSLLLTKNTFFSFSQTKVGPFQNRNQFKILNRTLDSPQTGCLTTTNHCK